MASRFRIPQPDRDFAMGSRPQDTLNRIFPGQQGKTGGIAGLGQANSFKPKQVGMQRRIPQQQQTQAQPRQQQTGGIKMSFAGDPGEIARTFQALVNNTGTQRDTMGVPNPTPLPDNSGTPTTLIPPRDPSWPTQPGPQPINDPVFTPPREDIGLPQPGPGYVITDPSWPHGPPTSTDPAPLPDPQAEPGGSNPVSEFSSLSDYLNAVGKLDLIDEDAYKAYSGWTPQLPEYAQQKIALDNQLQSQLVAAVGSQETAKAMQKLILSRLIEDELSDQSNNRAVAGARGLTNSSIKTNNAKRINTNYMRDAGNQYTDLISRLMGTSSGLAGGYGAYLSDILGASADEAASLYEAGLGAGSPNPTPTAGTVEDDIGTALQLVQDEIGSAKRIHNPKKKGKGKGKGKH